MSCSTCKLSLMDKIQNERSVDRKFDRSHRMVQIFMAAWAAIVMLDRLIGIFTHAYDENQMTYALIGGGLLLLLAFWGTRGHIQAAMMVMQINLAVFLLQFTATCFLYRVNTAVWSTIFYGLAAGILMTCSLMLFLNRDLEHYRLRIRQLSGKEDRKPLFYRTNSRLIRTKK